MTTKEAKKLGDATAQVSRHQTPWAGTLEGLEPYSAQHAVVAVSRPPCRAGTRLSPLTAWSPGKHTRHAGPGAGEEWPTGSGGPVSKGL